MKVSMVSVLVCWSVLVTLTQAVSLEHEKKIVDSRLVGGDEGIGGCMKEGTYYEKCWYKDAWRCTSLNGTKVFVRPMLAERAKEFETCIRIEPEDKDPFAYDAKHFQCYECKIRDFKKGRCSEPTLVPGNFLGMDHFGMYYTQVAVGSICTRRRKAEYNDCRKICNDIVFGRPLIGKDSEIVIADLKKTTGEALCEEDASTPMVRVAELWRTAAKHEHASVASFSQFSLELMRIGAPMDLIELAHRAALEEVGHAKLCLAAAAAVEGENKNITDFEDSFEALPMDATMEISNDILDIARRTALEGAIGETTAALQAEILYKEALEQAAPEQILDALRAIVVEESRHAVLGWKFLQWSLEKNEDVKEVVNRVFQEKTETLDGTILSEEEALPKGFGQLDTRRRQELAQEIFSSVCNKIWEQVSTGKNVAVTGSFAESLALKSILDEL